MPDPTPPLPRPVVLGLAVLTVVVVAALSLVLFRDDLVQDQDDAVAAATTVAPSGDDFERTDGALTDADHAWAELAGTWAVQDGHAALTEAGGGPVPGLAVLPREAADGTIRVTARAIEPGWGVAFRVQDEDDLWAVVARPDESAWSLVTVEAGVVDETERFVGVPPVDGDVVEITLRGDVIRVAIGSATAVEVVDPTLADVTDAGLVALEPENLPSMAWDDVVLSG